MSKIEKRICDDCGREIKEQWFLQVECYKSSHVKGDPPFEFHKALDFCDKFCLREWSNKGPSKP